MFKFETGARPIKGAVTVSILFFFLFVLYASVQASAYHNVVRKLTQSEQKNKELQRLNEELNNQLKNVKQPLKQAEKTQEQNKKIAYLTFDDGPSTNTAAILSILDHYKVKATFFVIGNNTDFGKQMYKRIAEEGHAIGLHSYTHEYKKIYASPAAFQSDFDQLRQLLYGATGLTPTIIRFPGGSNNHVSRKYGGRTLMQTLIKQVTKEGYQYVDWNVDSRDAERVIQSPDIIVHSILQESKNKQKAIILMHDAPVKTTTVTALPAVIEGLRKQGFSFDVVTNQSFMYRFAK
jgi:peptidoglycan/xylan/chitin deacetylase (PgdA/CDA1 family)